MNKTKPITSAVIKKKEKNIINVISVKFMCNNNYTLILFTIYMHEDTFRSGKTESYY